MLTRSSFAAIASTVYLVIYVVFLQTEIFEDVAAVLFFLSPLLLGWLTITILRYGKYNGKELDEDEYWGYQDFPDKELL